MSTGRPVTRHGFQEESIPDRPSRITTIPVELTVTQWYTIWFYLRKMAAIAELEGNPTNARVLRQCWAELTRQTRKDA